jgi:hypothetical protein
MTSDRTLTVAIATGDGLRRASVDLVTGSAHTLTTVDRTATSAQASCLELAENAAAGPGHRPSLVPWLVAKTHPRKGWLVVLGVVLVLVLFVALAQRLTRDNRPRSPDDFWG